MKHAKDCQYFISLMITFGCLTFVLYQSRKCLLKYYTFPKSADVSIQKAESYPEVTICPKDLTFYNDYLKQCNLSFENGSRIRSKNCTFCSVCNVEIMTKPLTSKYK